MREFASRTASLLAMLLAAQFANCAEYELRLQQGWGLISVTRNGSSLNGLMGEAITLPGFCFQRGQHVAVEGDHELQPGLGYWVFAYRNLRIPQDSEAAAAATVVPVELAVWNLVGLLPASPTYATLNNLGWEWRPPRYRAIRPAQMQLGTGYSIYPDSDQVQLGISQVDPVSPLPGKTVTLTVTGAQYLAAGGVVWFGNLPAPIIAADSANSIRVLAPAVSGTISLVLDAGHGIASAPFSITMPSHASALDVGSDLLDLVGTVIDTLNREHGAPQTANIATAEAQLLSLIGQLDLTPSVSLLLENSQVTSQLAILKSDIAARSLNPTATWANIQQALLWLDSYSLPQQLANLRSQQLTQILATGDPAAILNWQALDTLTEIIERAHALTDWVPTRLIDFRVDRSLCDSPVNCRLAYFADFAVDDPARDSLAEARAALLKSLPADFAIANSASTIQNTILDSTPTDLLIQRDWDGIQIDTQWMRDQGRGFRDPVFSSSLSECGIQAFRVEPIANSFSLQVIAQAAGFGRLDTSIFDRDHARIFTANTDLTVRPDIVLFQDTPTTASLSPFFDDPSDTVHSIEYRVVIEPTLPLPAECFVPGIRFTMDVGEPNLRISEASTQAVPTGLEIRQSYVLEPGLRPTLEQARVQAYAGTTTFIPLSVSGFNLPAASFEAALFVDDGRDFLRETERTPIFLPYNLPLAIAFNSAIEVNVLSSNLGTANVFPTAPLTYSMNYQVVNTPGMTDVVTVFVGVKGIGDDSSNPPNARIQELIVDLLQAPLRIRLDESFPYHGSSVAFVVDREFDVPLLPEEVSQLQLSVDPADDISLANGSMELAPDATPGLRSLQVTLGSEQASVQFEVVEDVLYAFLLSDTVYAGTAIEFGYSLASGSSIPIEDLGISILPSDDVTVNGNFLEVADAAEASQRTLTVSYAAKSASTTFNIIPDVLSITPDAASIFEGDSLGFSFSLASGETVANPVISVTPPDDITITGPEVLVAFGAAPGLRTLRVTAGAVTAETALTIVDDALLLTAQDTNAFAGADISFSVARLSGNALVGLPTLTVLPADDITVNGLSLEIADSATPGARTVTAELAGDRASIDIQILGDPAFIAIDLSSGSDALSYPVTSLGPLPHPLPAIYKTSSLLLRRVADRSFTMGSPSNELGHQANEVAHTVTFSSHSYMGVFEVTQRQWELVMGNRPSGNSPVDYEDLPVENVSYDDIRGSVSGSAWPANADVDANSFIGLLRARSGIAMDLPTEAQWENACRSGTTTALNNGSDLADLAVDANLDLLARYSNNANGSSGPVGDFLPNASGLYDMHGNVWEWCLDWSAAYSGAATDPVGAATGTGRTLRGGSYLLSAQFARSARRGQLAPGSKNSFFGLRLSAPAF